MEHTPIGATIRQLRRQRGLPAIELAKRVGITESALRKIEGGQSKQPSFRVGLRIAAALDVSPETLTGEAMASATSLTQTLRILREHRDALRELGVNHLGVFGSVARGDESRDSDVDVLIDVPDSGFSLLDLSSVALFLEDLLARRVDVLTTRAVKRNPQLRNIEIQAVNAF